MPAVPRTAPTGAPSATATADPLYTGNNPLTPLQTALARVAPVLPINSSTRIASASREYVAIDGVTINAVQAHTPTSSAVYTGQTAVERAEYIGSQVAAATGTSPITATQVVRDYRNRTGTYPDMSQLDALGSGYTGGNVTEGKTQQLGLLGGSLNTWILLSAVGLIAVLLFGKKHR